jgi:hypothetical protein
MFETITADLKRLTPSGRTSLRSLLSGLLSQGVQAIRFICERYIEITTGI